MRIGLVSDTHIPYGSSHLPYNGLKLPPQVAAAFADVDLILHAGDIYVVSVLDDLEQIAPTLAVDGGGTDGAIGAPRVVKRRVISVGGLNIGLIHMLGLPDFYGEVMPGALKGHPLNPTTLFAGLERTFGSRVQVVVFGDTHRAMVETHHGILLVNPGSPTLPNHAMRMGTVGLLEIGDGAAQARIIQLE